MRKLTEYTPERILISPSILAADFAVLGTDVTAVSNAGADLIHVDIMDGHFVPNISFGPGITKNIRPYSKLLFDVHLMISNPDQYLEEFAKAGADHITIHQESNGDTQKTLDAIHKLGCTAGITLRPGTPVEVLYPYLDQVEMVLVMTVEPGFGGQSFMRDQLSKIEALHSRIAKMKKNIHLEVDGGITLETAPLAIKAGANVLVAGSSIFKAKASKSDTINQLKHS
ncbi:MAG: ribulose-phosphate 3-epimerase [Lentisphaeria bacterium]